MKKQENNLITAREMFEQLGFYKEKENDVHIIFTCKSERRWKIRFQKTFESYYHTLDHISINKQLHNAITQQMKELGWIE